MVETDNYTHNLGLAKKGIMEKVIVQLPTITKRVNRQSKRKASSELRK